MVLERAEESTSPPDPKDVRVIVETIKGMIRLKATITASIHWKVVSVPHEWGGLANGNILTYGDVHDPTWKGSKMPALAHRKKGRPSPKLRE